MGKLNDIILRVKAIFHCKFYKKFFAIYNIELFISDAGEYFVKGQENMCRNSILIKSLTSDIKKSPHLIRQGPNQI
jgi:hypothetical protein